MATTRSDRPIYVYCLRHPRTGAVGYVGSGTDVEGRAGSHFAERLWGTSSKAEWIRDVWRECGKPAIVILEAVSEEARIDAEQRWLDKFRAEGHPITNRPGPVRRHC